jgi:F-type H+-transporting ATPase subunit gamma
MAGAKEIRAQIKSIQNTKKITKAMEMVAASKMRKAQDRMAATKPYAQKMRSVIGHVANAHPEYKHPFLQQREVKRVGFITVSTDRGLCGGLNVNLFRKLVAELKAQDAKGVEIDHCVIGNKGQGFVQRLGGNITSSVTHLGDAPRLEELIGTIKVMLDAYYEGKIDALYLAGNEFVNSMTQNPEVIQLLPVQAVEESETAHHWDYIYEPEAKDVLDGLMMRYIESQVYQAVVENVACEMSARMVAMKAASDNAGELIGELQLVYNKARQAAITQELSEIVAGAAAV